ncbi:MAG: alpha/beta hydrolase [candidate division KSB1 bacterium]|nr:alpha/beta hydrolase [candidate division KSB1 bacterium]
MNIKLLLMMALFLPVLTVGAQDLVLPLWPDGIPNFQQTDETEQLEDTGRLIKISSVQKPDISVFLPAQGIATGQAVVICPGGGYWILAYDWEGTDMAKWLNSKGIAAVVLKYRLPVSESNVVRHKSPLLDAQRALRLTRYHADDWHIHPDKVGIMGFSAGGHLASTAGTHFDSGDPDAEDPIERLSCRPDFMILGYPVIRSFGKGSGSVKTLLGPDSTNQELLDYYSNEKQVSADTPPTFLVHANDDSGVPVEHSLAFFKALRHFDIPAEMHIYPVGGHGFALGLDRGPVQSWTDRCVDWLQWLNREDVK